MPPVVRQHQASALKSNKGKAISWDDMVPDSMWMSAKQADKAIRQGAQAHLCIMRMDLNEGNSKCMIGDSRIKILLQEFQDGMPPAFPQGLPPKRYVDHRIELLPSHTPLAKAPYRMDLAKLQELKK